MHHLPHPSKLSQALLAKLQLGSRRACTWQGGPENCQIWHLIRKLWRQEQAALRAVHLVSQRLGSRRACNWQGRPNSSQIWHCLSTGSHEGERRLYYLYCRRWALKSSPPAGRQYKHRLWEQGPWQLRTLFRVSYAVECLGAGQCSQMCTELAVLPGVASTSTCPNVGHNTCKSAHPWG